MKWILKIREMVAMLGILLSLLAFTMIYYQTDKSGNFSQAWIQLIDGVEEELEHLSLNPASWNISEIQTIYDPQIIIFRDNRIVQYTNSWVEGFGTDATVEAIRIEEREGIHYHIKEITLEGQTVNSVAQLQVPVWFEDKRQQQEFFNRFFRDFVQTDYTFELIDGQLSIHPESAVRPFYFQKFLAYSWVIFVFFSIIFLAAKFFKHRNFLHKQPLQIFLLLAAIFSLRLIWELPFVNEIIESLSMFNRETYFLFSGGSLGKLTNDIFLFFGFCLFLLNYPLGKFASFRNPGLKAIFSVALYFIIILLFILFGKSVSQLVYFSDIQLDLEEVFSLDHFSFILLTVIMLYLFSVFILGLKAGELVIKLEIPLANRFMAAGAAALLSFPVFLAVGVDLPPFPFYLGVFIFVFLLDIFSENKKPGYPWLVLWLLILSGFGASMLFSFSLNKDIQQRMSYAEVFSNYEEKEELTFQEVYEKVKNLRIEGDRKYDYTVYQGNEKVFSTNSLYPDKLPESWNFESEGVLVRQESRSEWIKTLDGSGTDLQLIIGKYSSDYLKPFSLFSYLFFLSSILGLILLYLNSLVTIFPPAWDVRRPRARSLRRKIQLIIISLTLASLVLVSLITIFFFNVNSQRELRENLFTDLKRVKTQLQLSKLRWAQTPGMSPEDFERQLELKVGVFDLSEGNNLVAFKTSGQSGFPVYLNHLFMGENTITGPIIKRGINRNFPDKTGIFDQLVLSSGQTYGIIIIPDPVYRHGSLGFTDFLSTLINVFLFLFLLSGVLAFVFAEGITQPLLRLRENLNKIRLGKDNEPLEWENDDEIGELIKDYNRIISEINEGVKFMAMTEREDAWREMAKQIAHEIKNPLTPMKLSIQHLQFASKRGHDQLNPLIERTTATLIEQIDNLSHIASEFSSFAKMPEAKNEKVNLNEMVRSAHDLFRNREDMDIDLLLPIDDIFVFADKNYLIRVVTNLMKNSIQAIPIDRRGKIWIKLYRHLEVGIIEVQDNGSGISEEMKDKVFKPNFTSKTSGTGLGLAISQNIVEAFHGRIYFETEKDKGTRFFVEIPLMRMKGNLDEITRVNL